MVCLHALDELQADHLDRAKSFLARQVAYYYHSPSRLDTSTERQQLLNHIEASSHSSPELKEALTTKP
jgi:hypothetical protein